MREEAAVETPLIAQLAPFGGRAALDAIVDGIVDALARDREVALPGFPGLLRAHRPGSRGGRWSLRAPSPGDAPVHLAHDPARAAEVRRRSEPRLLAAIAARLPGRDARAALATFVHGLLAALRASGAVGLVGFGQLALDAEGRITFRAARVLPELIELARVELAVRAS